MTDLGVDPYGDLGYTPLRANWNKSVGVERDMWYE